MKSRDEILEQINNDRMQISGDSRVDIVIPDSEERHQNGIWSEDNKEDQDEEDAPKVLLRLSDVRWTPKLERALENILLEKAFDFASAASEFEDHLNRTEAAPSQEYRINGAELQMKWTQIEMRHMNTVPKAQNVQTVSVSQRVVPDDSAEQEPNALLE
jgi:hypothetical protein